MLPSQTKHCQSLPKGRGSTNRTITMNPAVILMYLLSFTSSVEANITFGSYKNPEYWWNLGLLPWHRLHEVPASFYQHKPLCMQSYGLSRSQLIICHQNFDHMPIISIGARIGILQCEEQFKFRHWNCSSGKEAFSLGVTTRHGTREASFAHAIASAGVVHALARSCKEARLLSCGCSKAERPQQLHRDWIWGGCGDNIDYAYRFSKAFVDIREKEKSFPRNSLGLARKLMNLHNNRVGRLAVYKLATVACKCHGMSGSCSLRTCWTQLSPFPRVGQRLQERYESAIKVKFNRRGTQLRRANRHLRQITSDHLIYLEESPNFCAVNPLTGRTLTSGRECRLQGHANERCTVLCCGRGHRTYTREVRERCYCQFHWCCSVECQTCSRREEVHICN
ncbi:wingless type MMTV integration site family [Echinococcus multilocularis]|uniref:Protein Wnt n=1 Tax=Echinococcus multilocularis TaxID=6211 RepID=A0A068YDS7_ECHMU|nr:wingless type MMTV integration site family [Echinococcus multilocularis]